MGAVSRCEVLGSAWGLYAAAGGIARGGWRMQKNHVERTNMMDLTTVDRVIQGPDAQTR